MTERKNIEAADAPDEYRYRKIYLSMLLGLASNFAIIQELGGNELVQKATHNAVSAWGKKISTHIARDFNLPKTIEGALELLIIYNDIWNAKKISAYMEDGAGYFDLGDCTMWDNLCKPLGIRCDKSCEKHEAPNTLSSLLDMNEYNLEIIESKPEGHERCFFKITKK